MKELLGSLFFREPDFRESNKMMYFLRGGAMMEILLRRNYDFQMVKWEASGDEERRCEDEGG